MIKTIHLFWSRWLTGQVMQTHSVTGDECLHRAERVPVT